MEAPMESHEHSALLSRMEPNANMTTRQYITKQHANRPIVAFICTGNSGRSQMAEGWMKELSQGSFFVYSAGTHPAGTVSPKAVEVMAEVGVDIRNQYPKSIIDLPNMVDYVITMGCGVDCPYIRCKSAKTGDCRKQGISLLRSIDRFVI